MAIEIATLKERLVAAEKQASAAAANHATELQQMSERCTQLERALIDEKHRAGAELESLHSRITELSVKAAKAHRCAEMFTAAKSTRDAAIKETREAREALAKQARKLEALAEQNKQLVAAVRAEWDSEFAADRTTHPTACAVARDGRQAGLSSSSIVRRAGVSSSSRARSRSKTCLASKRPPHRASKTRMRTH